MEYLVKGVDFLFNLAGQTSHLDSMRDPYPDLEINARAQLSILEACRRAQRRRPDRLRQHAADLRPAPYLPVDERTPSSPIDVNGINKLAGEQYHLLYHTAHGLRTSALRLTNTYGPGMRVKDARQTFVGIWIKNVLTGMPIRVYGDGSSSATSPTSMTSSTPSLTRRCIEPAVGTALNVGGCEPISLATSRSCSSRCNGGGDGRARPVPGRPATDRHRRLLLRRLGRAGVARLGAAVALEAGLARTLAYYRDRGSGTSRDRFPVPLTQRTENALAERSSTARSRRVVEVAWYVLGAEVEAFEAEFAEFVGARIRCRCRVGDRCAHARAYRPRGRPRRRGRHRVPHGRRNGRRDPRAGATPVLVDVDPETLTIAPDAAGRPRSPSGRARLSPCTCTGAQPT